MSLTPGTHRTLDEIESAVTELQDSMNHMRRVMAIGLETRRDLDIATTLAVAANAGPGRTILKECLVDALTTLPVYYEGLVRALNDGQVAFHLRGGIIRVPTLGAVPQIMTAISCDRCGAIFGVSSWVDDAERDAFLEEHREVCDGRDADQTG